MVNKHRKKNNKLKDQSGFTLLEIIAVIVILSILGVVALPKYFDLQDQAREQAMGAGVSEAMGRVNGYFAQQILGGERWQAIDYAAELSGGEMGDFELTVTHDDSDPDNRLIVLVVTGKAGTPIAGQTRTVNVPRPGI